MIEQRTFVCRGCGRPLAVSTGTSIATLDGTQLMVGNRIVFKCQCGKLNGWRRVGNQAMSSPAASSHA